MAGAIHSTGKKDYTTPDWILGAVRDFFRDIQRADAADLGIDLDPCSNPQSTVDAALNLMLEEEKVWNSETKQVEIHRNSILLAQGNWLHDRASNHQGVVPCWQFGDGLERSWTGLRVYFNPPFGYNKITKLGINDWINKAIEEAAWPQLEYKNIPEIIGCLPDTPETKPWKNGVLLTAQGRCQLARRVKFGGMKTGIPKPISLVYWGQHPEIFKEHFRQFGRVENPSSVYKDQSHIRL
ncbi:MAG: hypothetical protein M0000_07300 [Actinomycetota bacterium]|nr:hypothetical protein [Actinomycetota bacterium]